MEPAKFSVEKTYIKKIAIVLQSEEVKEFELPYWVEVYRTDTPGVLVQMVVQLMESVAALQNKIKKDY